MTPSLARGEVSLAWHHRQPLPRLVSPVTRGHLQTALIPRLGSCIGRPGGTINRDAEGLVACISGSRHTHSSLLRVLVAHLLYYGVL